MSDTKGKLALLGTFAILLIVVMLGSAAAFSKKPKDREALTGDFAEMRYPYSQLTEREQKLYSALHEGISGYAQTIALPDVYTDTEYQKVYLLLSMQEPEFFYLDEVYELATEMQEVRMYYRVSQTQAEQMGQALEAAADAIVHCLSPTQSREQQMLMIHDSIASTCFYGDGNNMDNAYGCLIEGVAKCEGYAKAFLYVARRAGFRAMCVAGQTDRGTAHVWNVAEVDGVYYNYDVTWDGDDRYGGSVAHIYYGVPDAQFADHIPELDTYKPPACTGTLAEYYLNRGYVINEANQIASRLMVWLTPSTEMLEFYCTDAQVYAAVKEDLQMQPALAEVIYHAINSTGYKILTDESRRVIAIVLK